MSSGASSSGPTLIGVDGGGTQTRAAVCSQRGAVYGVGVAGPGNYHNVGEAAVRDNIAQAVRNAWSAAGAPPRRADAAFLGLGSIVTDDDRRCIRRIASDLELAPDDKVGVDHDLRAAAAGAFSGGEGIVLVAGTGSAAFGVNHAGEAWRSGGWGPTIDDAGSAYWLGMQAIKQAVKAHDGRGPQTRLSRAVHDHFEVDDINQLMFLMDAHSTGRRRVASLATEVVALAAAGDAVAVGLIGRAAVELAQCVKAVSTNLAFQGGELRVAVVGGLVKAGRVFMDPLRQELLAAAPGSLVVDPDMPPVEGALLLAGRLLGPGADASPPAWRRADARHATPPTPPSAANLSQPQTATE